MSLLIPLLFLPSDHSDTSSLSRDLIDFAAQYNWICHVKQIVFSRKIICFVGIENSCDNRKQLSQYAFERRKKS